MDKSKKAYPQGCLERLQTVERDLLAVFDSICRKEGLTYFADGGTLLGAVRHGGFIPWDDDVDVAMPFDDYERFLRLAQHCLPEGYSVNTTDNNPDQAIFSAKLIRDHTLFYTGELEGSNAREGIFMDIFPFVRLDSSLRKANRQVFQLLVLQNLSYLRHIESPRIPKNAPLKPLLRFACRIVHHTIGQVWTTKQLAGRAVHVIHKGDQQGQWTSLAYPTWGRFEENELFPCKDLQFDGLMVSCPYDYNVYLTKEYGDYMTIPPESERYTHLPVVLDFGDGINVMELEG